MSDASDNIIVDTATRIFQDLCEPATINDAEKGVWPKALWDALQESGLPLAWVSDDFGGAGATMADGFAVLVGHHSGDLVQMSEVMYCPRRQQVRQRDCSEGRVASTPLEVPRTEIQCAKFGQVFRAHACKSVE